jgi:hypothetical protein
MNCDRAGLTACVVKSLPNARDYAYKNRGNLLREKSERDMDDSEEDRWLVFFHWVIHINCTIYIIFSD